MNENLDSFKQFYINLLGMSDLYPGISLKTFTEFCTKCNLLDKQFNILQVNRQFIAANIDINEEAGDNVASELIRYEFAEILVRIVKVKWIDCNKLKSYYEGLGKLFEMVN